MFKNITNLENLLEAWREFVRGKRSKSDVQEFSLNLMDNLLNLSEDLSSGRYRHGGYEAFNIFDPKPRSIHKASVRDRLLHHAIYRILYPLLDRQFIADSFSCRLNKGTHKALNRFRSFAYKVSRNNTRTCWVLKCDIRKFFANINHEILLKILRKHISDTQTLALLEEVIGSFSVQPGVGLPLGNLTSQLLVNIYMNEFDQFMKQKLKVRYYLRYADDFVIFSEDKNRLINLIPVIQEFLGNRLRLELHPQKVFIKTLVSGVDFLGRVHFFDHRVLRRATKRRMLRRIAENPKPETLASYLGLLRHGNAKKIKEEVLKFVLK